MKFILPLALILMASPAFAQNVPAGSPLATANANRSARLASITSHRTNFHATWEKRLKSPRKQVVHH